MVITLRRNLEQAKHCVEEALSVIMAGEPIGAAIEDIDQAMELLKHIKALVARMPSDGGKLP